MKTLKKIFLPILSMVVVILNLGLIYWLETLFYTQNTVNNFNKFVKSDLNLIDIVPQQGTAIAMAIIAGVTLVAGVVSKVSANNKRNGEEAKARRAQKKLEALEKNRQGVIDQSDQIRDLKNQVFNPFANLTVATQTAELKIEQTDQALANTLDKINQGGTGAGAATAMARMAAASKAQVGASLENQEAKNNTLRAEGEAKSAAAKMQIEQAALAAEEAAWNKQENRDLASLDRLSGLQENASANAMAYQQQGDQALMDSINSAGSIYAGGMKSGGSGGGTTDMGTFMNQTGMSYTNASGVANQASNIAGNFPGSDRRLKQNITQVGKSLSGLNIYTFEYKDKSFGEGVWHGVMSDEIPKEAVIKHKDGFDRVDYSKLDVTFKKYI